MAKVLAYDLLARDRASEPTGRAAASTEKLRKSVDKLSSSFSRVSVGSRGVSAAFGLVGKGAALAAGAGGLALLAKGFKDSYSEAREAQKTTAQTNAVIKSTGGVANLSADAVGNLATAISNKVGVDDEAIQSGANLLLTFTNIRNEAGQGNDIFNRTTAVVTDMAAAMNQGAVTSDGLKTASIQVGKALNDPVKGITALTKVGVTFSKQQKDQIAGYVKSGQTLKAQKIILAELNKEFGGSAAAGSTATQKLGVAFKNIEETIGGVFLPVIDKAATWLASKLPAAADKVIPFLTNLGREFGALVALIGRGDFTSGFAKAFHVEEDSPVVAFILKVRLGVIALAKWITGTAIPAVQRFAQEVGPKLAAFLAVANEWIQTRLIPAFQRIAAYIQGTVVPAIQRLAAFLITNLGPAVTALAGFIVGRVVPALQQLAVKIGPVIAFAIKMQVIFLAIAVVIIGKVVPVLVSILGPAFTFVVAVIGKVIGVVNTLQHVFVGVVKVIADVWLTVVGFLVNGAAKAFGWVPGLGGKLKGAAAAFNDFRDRVNSALAGINDRTVNVNIITRRTEGVSLGPASARPIATGGPVIGPGTGTSDSILARVSNGEHMWTAAEVSAAGGHSAVEAIRAAALSGGFAYAGGGAVGKPYVPQGRRTGGRMDWPEGGEIHVHLHGGTFVGTNRRQFGLDLIGIMKEAAKSRGQGAPIK